MEFILHADRTVATRQGHIIAFKKGVPTHVPKECWPEVLAAGAVAGDQKKLNEETPKKTIPEGADREESIMAAFSLMEERNKREDFAASGMPSLKPLSLLCEFEVDARERDALWSKYKQTKKD